MDLFLKLRAQSMDLFLKLCTQPVDLFPKLRAQPVDLFLKLRTQLLMLRSKFRTQCIHTGLKLVFGHQTVQKFIPQRCDFYSHSGFYGRFNTVHELTCRFFTDRVFQCFIDFHRDTHGNLPSSPVCDSLCAISGQNANLQHAPVIDTSSLNG